MNPTNRRPFDIWVPPMVSLLLNDQSSTFHCTLNYLNKSFSFQLSYWQDVFILCRIYIWTKVSISILLKYFNLLQSNSCSLFTSFYFRKYFIKKSIVLYDDRVVTCFSTVSHLHLLINIVIMCYWKSNPFLFRIQRIDTNKKKKTRKFRYW